MQKRVGLLIALLLAFTTRWAVAEGIERPPSGLRRAVGAASSRVMTNKVIRNSEVPYPATHDATQSTLLDKVIDTGELIAAEEAGVEDAEPAWVATHPDPGEPLGFSGAQATPRGPVDAPHVSGVFDETYVPFHEPARPHCPAPTASSGEWIRDGFWYTQQSAVYLSPSAGPKNDVVLATDLQATILPESNPMLSIPTDIGWAPGLRSVLGRRVGRDYRNRDHSIEFTFLGLTHWGAAAGLESLTGGGIFTNIDPTLAVPAFNQSRFQRFDLTSDFNSYEVNYRIERRLARDRLIYSRDSVWIRQATPALLPALFVGLRIVNLDERLSWLAESDVEPSTGSYLVRTTNRMVGPQIGGDLFYERSDWRFGARARAAAVVNWAAQSSDVRILDSNGDPLLPNRDEYAKVHEASFVGEFNFSTSYHLRPNFAMRFSYDLMWLTNLALAQNQLTFNPGLPAVIANSNTLFFQGLSFGFEIVR